MICSHCKTKNPEEAKFCMSCGNSLMLTCPNCGHVNPPIATFCIECGYQLRIPVEKSEPIGDLVSDLVSEPIGDLANEPAHLTAIPEEYAEKLEAARKAQTMQGERRIVSILFCDVKGSTSMAEKLDPEEWAEIINQAFEILIAPIYAYEGTLARLMGDSVLAFFGAPIAHEDDARRAVLAGLDIVKNIQPFKERINRMYNLDFDVRVGINTGLVVVGGVGSDLFMEYTALGDAINIAARMEQTAKPGTVQIWEDTYKLAAPYFETELVEGIEIKGKNEAGKVYRVLGVKEVQGRSRGIQGVEAPLTGRSAEFDVLKGVLAAVEKGRGQVVCLMGEAGLGKSRLLRETREVWEEGDLSSVPFGKLETRWNQTMGISYEASRPYGLTQRLIRNFLGITASDGVGDIREKLLETFNEVELSPEQIDLFEIMLGVKEAKNGNQLSGEDLKRAIYSEMLAVLGMLVQQNPTVICIDDLHWSDPASGEFIIHLFQLADRYPILFLCAFRPDHSSPAWKIKQEAEMKYAHRFTELSLSPLDEKQSGELLDQLLQGSQFPQNIRRMILKKSDGNPFFMEEVVRTLIENKVVEKDLEGGWRVVSDIDNIAIPDNLQTLLAARIDRLEENAKQVLQMASVIGRTFYHQVLENIHDASNELDHEINTLLRLGLILEAQREPYHEYFFRQALTQETVYNTILLRHRREFHQKVGEALLALFPERLDEFNSVIGHHFYLAQDVRALEHFRREGDLALNLYANQEAVSYYSKAIEVAMWAAELDLDELESLYACRGRANELNSQFSEALENYRELEVIAKENQGHSAEMSALISQAQIYSIPNNEFNIRAGLSIIEKAKAIAEEIDDQKALAKVYWILTNLYRFQDDLIEAQQFAERSISLARELGMEEQLAFSLNDAAHAYTMNGLVDRGREKSLEAVELWRKQGNQAMLADCIAGLSAMSVFSGDYDDAIQYSDEAYEISLSIDNIWGQSYSRYAVGMVYLDRGDFSKAIEIIRQSIRDAEVSKFLAGVFFGRAFISLSYIELGDFQSAEIEIQKAHENFEGNPTISNEILAGINVLLKVKSGKIDEAVALYGEYAFEEKPIHFLVTSFYKMAECYLKLAQGDLEGAALYVEDFRADSLNSGVRFQDAELLMLAGAAYGKRGEHQKAKEELRAAVQAAKKIGDRRVLWQVYYHLGQCEMMEGNEKEAAGYFEQAKEVLSFIVDGLEKPGWKEMFLARPDVKDFYAEMERQAEKEGG